ncbi:MAG: bifunctional ornithine acetyltransferase/N-acetylglutamate synthase, partial [Sphingomonadaceae bacterium]|nr:bifunctional ornithine acetyltransferase/N-acetylglutamate synthase [Sphingomonadaceae bacterium]
MSRSPLALDAFPTLAAIPGATLHIARARYKDWDRCDLTFVALDEGAAVAGLLTKSACPSPEVEWCRAALTGGKARALVVNAGNANAFTGARGRAAVEAIAKRAAAHLGSAPGEVFVASTGVIGVSLPMREVNAGILAAAHALSADGDGAFSAAIQTTDAFEKRARVSVALAGGVVTLTAQAKGAG